ncbi:MAG: BamA/TamA family outer membrane protein, partial [Planctomycetaceae bacterium]|nr:BamA/TamA family outer membrane protein [Planctomycetaceae bacterium]
KARGARLAAAGSGLVALSAVLLGLAACAGPYRTHGGLEVSFRGNDRISSSRLWDTVRERAEDFARNGDRTLLSDACFQIAHLYELEGRERSEVEYRLEERKLVFEIREARYYALGKIRILGSHGIPEKELVGALPHKFIGSLPYSQLLVQELSGKIRGVFEDRGFKDVQIGEPEPRADYAQHRVDVTFQVQEGPLYRIARIEGLETAPEPLRKRAHGLEGKPYTPQALEELEAVILDHYREHGYPFVRVQVRSSFKPEEAAAVLQLDLTPGSYARIGDLKAEGLSRANPGFLKHRADLEPGKEFHASDLRRAEERIAATGLFETVQVDPGAEDPDSSLVPVFLRVRERDPGEVAFRLGYGTLDGGRAGVDLRYADVLGNAELFRIGGTISRFGYRAESELAFPYFLGSEFRPGLSAYYETETYPSFSAVSFGGAVSVSRPLSRTVTATLGVRHAVIRTTEVDEDVPPGDLLDFSYSAPFVSLHWDDRDSALLPTRGGLVDIRFEYSDRSYSPDIQFWNLNGRVTYLVPLPWSLTLAASFQGGLIAPIQDTDVIPISLRYFAGGTNTVRGFKFASLGPEVNGEATGGETFLSTQLELRYLIWENLHGAVFTDRGGVWEDYTRVDLGDLRYSIGTGLRYHTPAGPLVADFGFNPARRAGEAGWAFHFSIGFPF